MAAGRKPQDAPSGSIPALRAVCISTPLSPSMRQAAGAIPNWAVSIAYLRGQGKGRVAVVDGVKKAQSEVGSLVVEAKLPTVGAPRSSSYEGDGYVILRHPDTDTVIAATKRLIETVRVHYR